MASRQLDEEAIFHVARGIPEIAIRAAYLDQVCAGDQRLRERVEALLQADEQEQGVLQSVAQPEVTIELQGDGAGAGEEIGRYKLREKLGEGGFGIVWAAEQSTPVRRKVALKIIKPGMDSRDVVARFEAERQALALMDHPNIARVLDGGATPNGRPYFVMELIRGVPITDYCDENRLTIAERLLLHIDVCKAVQHAHQKGIIHRDIKPSNVLVTLHDNKPVPKVIDFGVAKALSQPLTNKTIYTRVHAAVGTLAYMAPEQAALSSQDIDTRSDVYGLGVLLYELLTGGTPHDSQRLARAAMDEAFRIIREEEPQKASTRLSSLGATATALSASRRTDPAGLQKQVRGELDWIVMKALEKDRSRRYESAGALASDIGRLLNHEPVEACPPSTAYRVRKFVQRNVGLVTAATVILGALIAGSVGTTSGWIAANRASREARAQERIALEQKEELKIALGKLKQVTMDHATTAALSGNLDKAADAIRAAKLAGATESELALLDGEIAYFRGRHEEAIQLLNKLLESDPENVAARALREIAYVTTGKGYTTESHTVRKLPVRTTDDQIFMAMMELNYDLEATMKAVNAAIEVRPAPLALDVRANYMLRRANYSHNLEDARRAIDAVEELQILLGRNGYTTWLELYAYNVAYQSALAADRQDLKQQYLDAGDEVANRLEKHPETTVGIYSRYLHAVNTQDKKEQWRLLQKLGDTPVWYLNVAANRFENVDDPREALKDFDAVVLRKGDPWYRLARAHLLAQIPDAHDEAVRIYDELAAEPTKKDVWLVAPFALSFLGDEALLRRYVKNLPRRDLEVAFRGHYSDPSHTIAYLAGELTEDMLLMAVGTTNTRQCAALATIGTLELARGHREKAMAAFQKCVETGAYNNSDFTWAGVVLERMKRDANWPPRPRPASKTPSEDCTSR